MGESPVPGLTLRRILRGHTGEINRIAWSPDGRYLASPSDDKTIRIWDVAEGKCTTVLVGHENTVFSLAWLSADKRIVSVGKDGNAHFWNLETKEILKTYNGFGAEIYSLSLIGVEKNIAIGGFGNAPIEIIDAQTAKLKLSFDLHNDSVFSLSERLNDKMLASCSGDHLIQLWDADGKIRRAFYGHTDCVTSIIFSSNGEIMVSGSLDKTIRLWNPSSGLRVGIFEGHTTGVNCVHLSSDGQLLASKSRGEGEIRLWKFVTGESLAIFNESATDSLLAGIAFHPHYPFLATLGENGTVIRIWDLDIDFLLGKIAMDSVRYTTAKLVLVGDSGVGKTGLGWRLAHNDFREHASTHGQQFWLIDGLCTVRSDGTECDAVLWDLAGQPDYRLVHSLFLDDVDAALVLFDPTNRQEPLSGVDFWLNQLRQKGQNLCNSVLVGARTDRGISTLTVDELQAYCERNGISGGYIPTSALSGEGLPELLERVKAQISWDAMTATVTTQTFKRIKKYVLVLKEQTNRKNVLVHPVELSAQLQVSDPDWEFSNAEMMTAVGHLANHGYVIVLRGSEGSQSILLKPDLLANLASSIVLEARRDSRGLGVLDESRLLAGDYHFLELDDLEKDECDILLNAAVVLFLEHNLCFRETFNHQTFLVFPSLINEKRPKIEDFGLIEGASYHVKGAVETVFASLVVLLGYTNTFIRTHQWQNQAQYEMGENEICGFQQTENRDGELELVLYYGERTPEPVRLMFRGMFERFLSRRKLEISRYQPIICTNPICNASLARNVVLAQLNRGKNFSFCNDCGKKLSLPSPEPLTRLSQQEESDLDIQQEIAKRRTAFEAALVHVKTLLRDRDEEKKPTCFISYAWGVTEHERWVLQLAKDLRNSGINVLLDRWHSPPGSNLDLFVDRILSSDFVIPVGTPKLQEKYKVEHLDPVVAAELNLINLRVRQPTAYGNTVLPVLLYGDAQTSFSPQLQTLVSVDFRDSANYFRKLFDMIWRLYELPFDNPLLEELQASMSP